MSEFGFGFRSLLGKNPKTLRVLIFDPEHQENPQSLTQGGWTPKKAPTKEWSPTPKKMATQTITRLTSIPEHTLDEALQNPKGEPSTPAKGKESNPFMESCNGGPSPVPRPKVLPEGRPILHSHNYTLTINNNYRTDHYCSRFSYYYKNQSSTM